MFWASGQFHGGGPERQGSLSQLLASAMRALGEENPELSRPAQLEAAPADSEIEALRAEVNGLFAEQKFMRILSSIVWLSL
jgi:hypothetical protein